MPEYKFLLYETLDSGRVVRIMLNRPDSRNAQNRGLLVELNDAFMHAESEDDVRVVILGGTGPMFSSGHDLGSKVAREEGMPGPNQHPTRTMNGATRKGAEALMLQEWHYFYDNTRRWRNLRKITIGQAHGDVYAAGLMLLWACDLIVCAEGTRFADVVGARLGMVSKVFPGDELADRTLEYAQRIAALPTMTALLIKESVNQSVDNMGFYNALNACFTLHELNHSHWAELHPDKTPRGLPEDGTPDWRSAPPIVPARPDLVRAPEA